MCGICGAWALDGQRSKLADLRAMNDTLRHRGPDGEGYYHPQGDEPYLAMRRLAVIDVGGSRQPLHNEAHTVSLVFNGEIFNYRELRAHLLRKGHQFHTEGDGETIVHLYEDDGLGVFQQLRGQFAIALYDQTRHRLVLARDPIGQLPLYYYHDGRLFAFASEIKALLAHPLIPRRSALTDPHLLALYLGYGAVPAPLTAYQGIRMLPAGHYLVLEDGHLRESVYWRLPEPAPPDPTARLDDFASAALDALRESVALRLIADVPLGAFLSGGVDSSLIVALMRQLSSAPIKTFSMGFVGDPSFDETAYAEQVARYLGTEHRSFQVQPQAISLIETLVRHYDQPFGDSSAIPTALMSQATRQHVTVALTGDGGDELFAGYERFWAAHLAQQVSFVPRSLWRALARLTDSLPQGTSYYDRAKRLGRFVRALGRPSLALTYFDWVRVFSAEQLETLLSSPDYAADHFLAHFGGQPATLPSILRANMATYLHDDLLIKTDRCSMLASLEARIPFLDHKFIEHVARVPFNLKLQGRTTKALLKQMARGLLPDSIIQRPKHGFGAPVGAWLRRDMSQVRDLLQGPHSCIARLFHAPALARLLDEHERGQRDHASRLWALLTLEAWQRQQESAIKS
ncbi:MAG: asparagine synthase (glutamine-hydrolyzing) [Anaerolineae bacterium]|nr:asparagine synthase (glutamine-hydrolyzing) [Anaerolineae bacterium]MDW8173950.1 asparagine synthase (glutamine-hydrolyzing) [Anaerolineae bacterium]